jgi:hypothetical protein
MTTIVPGVMELTVEGDTLMCSTNGEAFHPCTCRETGEVVKRIVGR